MSKKKSIAVAVVLLLVLVIGGMLAYFTDTDTATNVFTLGDNIEISLHETNWSNGNSGNLFNYVNIAESTNIHPGAQIPKDPHITNDSTTTPAYVFLEVIVPCYDSNGDSTVDADLFTLNSISNAWTLINIPTVDTAEKTKTYVYAYGTSLAMTSLAAQADTAALFTSVTLVSTLTSAQRATAGSSNIVVNAYGIQTDALSVSAPADIFALFGSN